MGPLGRAWGPTRHSQFSQAIKFNLSSDCRGAGRRSAARIEQKDLLCHDGSNFMFAHALIPRRLASSLAKASESDSPGRRWLRAQHGSAGPVLDQICADERGAASSFVHWRGLEPSKFKFPATGRLPSRLQCRRRAADNRERHGAVSCKQDRC